MTSSFPTVTATIALRLSGAVIQDINTHWISQASGPIGFLASNPSPGDTTLLLQQAADVAIGSTVLVDDEPMQVTAVNGTTLTVVRYAAAFPFIEMLPVPPTTTHASGASVMLLRWPDPWTLIAQESLRPWAQQVVIGLGEKSATFGAIASGGLSINS